MQYEMVIGLETHVELSTKTKIFCGCTTAFGGEQNTHCCPVCVGLPGSLPKLNRAVVEYAVKAGLATNCQIATVSKMDRKNYVYPDLAKAYQISQFDYPLCLNGHITLSDGHTIRLNRIHIEEDAGKLVHEGGEIFVDYNRGGVPLIEIVTEPDFRSPEQVREYLEQLRLTMKYLDVSDCKMQEGSMRCDVNISIRPKGSNTYGTRTEIKNVNSLAFIVKAIQAEFERQVDAVENGEKIVQETLRYNEADNSTESMRGKEDSNDYRYFRDPDLPIVTVSQEEIDRLRDSLPELPAAKAARYQQDWGISPKDCEQITRYAKVAAYFETMAELSGAPKLCANVMLTHLFRYLDNEEEKEAAEFAVSAEEVAKVIKMIHSGEISNNFTKKIIDAMMEQGKPFDQLFDKSEFAAVETGAIEPIVQKVIDGNEKIVADFKGGKEKAIGALIGMVMKETRGKADAKTVESMLREKMK